MGDTNMCITSIDGYRENKETVIFETKSVAGERNIFGTADRTLFMGGEDIMGADGKKLLKFLVDHYAGEITDDRIITLAKRIDADWLESNQSLPTPKRNATPA